MAILFSLLLNSLVLWILTWQKKMNTRKSNIFITNIAICNEVNAILVMPFVLSAIINDSWQVNRALCMFNGYTTSICFYSSVFSLCLISVDRYVAICMATKYCTLITKRRSKWMIASVWIICAVLSLPPLFGWSRFEYHPGTFHCSPRWLGQCGYYSFVFLLAIGLPNGVTVMSYTMIFMEVRKHRKKLSRWKKKEGEGISASRKDLASQIELPKKNKPEEGRVFESEVDEDELTSSVPALDNLNFEPSVVVKPPVGVTYLDNLSPNALVMDELPPTTSALETTDFSTNDGGIDEKLQTVAGEVYTAAKEKTIALTTSSHDPHENISDLAIKPFGVYPASSVDYFLLTDKLDHRSFTESGMGTNDEDTFGLIVRSGPEDQRNSIDSGTSTSSSGSIAGADTCNLPVSSVCRDTAKSSSSVLSTIPESCVEGAMSEGRIRGMMQCSANKEKPSKADALYRHIEPIHQNDGVRRETSRMEHQHDTKHLVRDASENRALAIENPLYNHRDTSLGQDQNTDLSNINKHDLKINGELVKNPSFKVGVTPTKGGSRTRRIKKSEKMAKEFQIAKTGAMLLGLFVICYCPYPIVHTCKDFYHIPRWSQHIAMWLVFLNSVISPIIYGFTNKDVRSELKRLSAKIRSGSGFSRHAN